MKKMEIRPAITPLLHDSTIFPLSCRSKMDMPKAHSHPQQWPVASISSVDHCSLGQVPTVTLILFLSMRWLSCTPGHTQPLGTVLGVWWLVLSESTRSTGATSGWALWLEDFKWNRQSQQLTGVSWIARQDNTIERTQQASECHSGWDVLWLIYSSEWNAVS